MAITSLTSLRHEADRVRAAGGRPRERGLTPLFNRSTLTPASRGAPLL
jgi:hypothetical protein